VADYFKEVAGDVSLPVLVDHLDERTDAIMQATDRAEVRITGPFVKNASKDYYLAFVDISVLLVSRYDGSRKSAYDILKYTGVFFDAMSTAIEVWNFGGEDGDYVEDEEESQILLGCLEPRPGQSIQVIHFGQTAQEEKCKITEITCKYQIELRDE
jgi:hypothetical protein